MLCRDSCRETWPEKFGKNYKVSLNALNTDDVNDSYCCCCTILLQRQRNLLFCAFKARKRF